MPRNSRRPKGESVSRVSPSFRRSSQVLVIVACNSLTCCSGWCRCIFSRAQVRLRTFASALSSIVDSYTCPLISALLLLGVLYRFLSFSTSIGQKPARIISDNFASAAERKPSDLANSVLRGLDRFITIRSESKGKETRFSFSTKD